MLYEVITKSGYLTPAVDFESLDMVLVITELKEKFDDQGCPKGPGDLHFHGMLEHAPDLRVVVMAGPTGMEIYAKIDLGKDLGGKEIGHPAGQRP